METSGAQIISYKMQILQTVSKRTLPNTNHEIITDIFSSHKRQKASWVCKMDSMQAAKMDGLSISWQYWA